jgi:glucose-1-phosphate thymidylyltransferase
MKGIILAGGNGSRLYPVTHVTSKQLLPVFDKPMIYYPLSMLMFAGIREILIISSPYDLPRFEALLKDGSHLGLKISYAIQQRPEGLAQALIIAKDFLAQESACLILGDNIFYGHDLPHILQKCASIEKGAKIFAYHVKNPKSYGVVTWNENKKVESIEEKPQNPKSSYAVPGIYFYDSYASDYALKLKPSKRGELEITDLNRVYLEKGLLDVEILGRGYAWLDTGTFQDLHKASLFVETIQERQGIKISCVEEIAYRMGYISQQNLLELSDRYKQNEYGEYLNRIALEHRELSLV